MFPPELKGWIIYLLYISSSYDFYSLGSTILSRGCSRGTKLLKVQDVVRYISSADYLQKCQHSISNL